jgi:hypothetical protein
MPQTILAENILSQVDDEGHNILLMRDIVDYNKVDSIAVPIGDKYLLIRSGQRRMRKATQLTRKFQPWVVFLNLI